MQWLILEIVIALGLFIGIATWIIIPTKKKETTLPLKEERREEE